MEKESVLGEIHLTGDTMYDAFLKFSSRVDKCDILNRLNITEREYALLTLHRAENVDDLASYPLSYIEMLKLLKHANVILTDSGGVQKEAFWSKTPCITLRDSTEWTETVEIGVNQITGADAEKIAQAVRTVEEKHDEIKERFKGNPFGDGDAARKIVEILKEKVKEGE